MDPGSPAQKGNEAVRAGALAPFADPATRRAWAVEANDGIIATAGLLQGFAGAGASERILLFTATAATIAGGLAVGGGMWAENAAERDAQLLAMEQERHELATDPLGELQELARFWETKGLAPDLAQRVAEELSARDALAAQLEWEHGFTEPMDRGYPIWFAAGAGLAYITGALIPLLITYFAPVAVETWAILTAVVVALALSSLVAARTGGLVPRRMVTRTIVVGLLTMSISFVAGELLL